MKNRREFLKASLAGGGTFLAQPYLRRGGGLIVPSADASSAITERDPWSEVPGILRRIKPPTFPDKDFDISSFGAAGDNETDCTEAFQNAIAACHSAGGGRVVVSPGQYLTGAIALKSSVNLHVSHGATVRFSRDTRKYPLVFTSWEGVELMNYSPFIYAFEQENIAITGKGTIDGNADGEHWWSWKPRTNSTRNPAEPVQSLDQKRLDQNKDQKTDQNKDENPDQNDDRNQLFDMAERGVPVSQRVFGEGHYLRPQFIQPYRCNNVLIEGVTLYNSPMWQVTPVLCTNVTVQDLVISSFGPNTDGCDPESCTDVLIKDCFFNTGDDCIAIKSGRNADGRRVNVPSRNIVIQGCRMRNGHGGVTIGSEISGGVSNIFCENCRMDSPYLDIAVRIKNNSMRGGLLENIYARNIEVGQVAFAAFSVDYFYEEADAGKFPPVTRNVEIRNLKIQKAKYAIYLRGFKNAPIENVRIVDCDFNGVAKPDVIENVKNLLFQNVKENGKMIERSS